MEESTGKIFRVTIYLKSGQSLSFDTTTLTTKRSPLTNELTGLEWRTPDDTPSQRYRRLSYVRLDDIAAITAE